MPLSVGGFLVLELISKFKMRRRKGHPFATQRRADGLPLPNPPAGKPLVYPFHERPFQVDRKP